jgi:hypothetical protein
VETILAETKDLLVSCPIWEFLYPNSVLQCNLPYFRRAYAIRRAWSHRVVELAWPCDPCIPYYREHDGMTFCQWFFRHRCRTVVLWKVVGPEALMADLAGDPHNPDAGARQLNLYLCQHEIRGD